MIVYALTGIPFCSRQQYILGVYELEEDAEAAMKEYNEQHYSDLEIEEVTFYEHYIDNSLDYD